MLRNVFLALSAVLTLAVGAVLAGPRFRVEYAPKGGGAWVHTGDYESLEKARKAATKYQKQGCVVRVTDLGAVPPGPTGEQGATPTPEEDGPSAYGFKTRAASVTGLFGDVIEVKLDARIQGAKGRPCVIKLVFCNADGDPLHTLEGKETLRTRSVTPATDSHLAECVSFYFGVRDFRKEFGPKATTMTAYVVVEDAATGKRLNTPNRSDVLRIDLKGKLPAPKPEPVDYPDQT